MLQKTIGTILIVLSGLLAALMIFGGGPILPHIIGPVVLVIVGTLVLPLRKKVK